MMPPMSNRVKKIGSSLFETWGLEVHLVAPEQFIVFRNLPFEFLFNDTKITLYNQKCFFFLIQNYTPYTCKPFLPKQNFLCLIFCDLSSYHLKDYCSNHPGRLTLPKFSHIVKKKQKLENRKVFGPRLKRFRMAANNKVVLDKTPVGNKVNTKGRIKF